MPWCPKCKNEYRSGITVCADCKCNLVETLEELAPELNYPVLVAAPDAVEICKRFNDFLAYSKIPSRIAETEDRHLCVYSSEEYKAELDRCKQAFVAGENELRMEELIEQQLTEAENEEDNQELRYTAERIDRNKNYKSAVNRYEDYKSSSGAFLIIGLAGTVFGILNLVGVIKLFDVFPSVMITILFLLAFAYGLFSVKSLGKLKEAAEREKVLVQQANEWLRDNITKETLSNYAVVAPEDTAKVYDLEEETVHDLEYLQTQENVRLELMKVFPPLHEVLAEQLVDEFFDNNFSENE